MNAESAMLAAFETHDVECIREVLNAGFAVSNGINEQPLTRCLIEMYTRSDRFTACLRLLLERGATLDDPALEPILLNDPVALEHAVSQDRTLLQHRTTLACAFTPLVGATLLHVAAEYGHFSVAKKLLELGVAVDVRADLDSSGMNGHTPLFHTVNSNDNRSAPVMHLLLESGACADLRLHGITWGKGFSWETTLCDVSPLSYTQFGMLPQMHRSHIDCTDNVKVLLRAAGRTVPSFDNVPNRYLCGG